MSDRIVMCGSPTETIVKEKSFGTDPAALMAMMQNNNKLDPAAMMAMMNNGGMGGGNNFWWIFIIVLWWMWGGNGNGIFGGRNASQLGSELNNDANTNLLMQAINGNKEAINQLATTVGCDTGRIEQTLCAINGNIDKVAGDVRYSSAQVINAIQAGDCQVISKIADCCCATQRSVDSVNLNLTKMSADNVLANCQQTNTLVNTMNQNSLNLRDANLANTQAILQKIDNFENLYRQDKYDRVLAENLALKNQLSQSQQNQYISATVQANSAPIVGALNTLQSEVESIKCKMPPTVSVPYPQLRAFNTDCYQAAAFGALSGEMYGLNNQCC